jgi:hypothetical protein
MVYWNIIRFIICPCRQHLILLLLHFDSDRGRARVMLRLALPLRSLGLEDRSAFPLW